MSNVAIQLIEICRQYVNNNLNIDGFIENFQVLYEQKQDLLTDEEMSLFDDIYMACEYYERDENIRNEYHLYIGENELRQKVQKLVKKLAA
ncbi:hypothetical protein BVF91_09480 [Thermoanaerobacterium sp. PSU-2]|jgi:hypothetical protein|uniref:colicin immunity domain-containing protein n=1 Tax=Thermoanaerobacterium sp. PSU-2 TaxID=1930849 RepID=UPI000A160B40|nr:colicin immunity domain-containing protein [Thermoanaerobacterium sp. PSU-2]ORX22867.1 hypothetical protein BVF91_09480 [Thermoanaerobacterium sp. PSU-2]